MGQKRTLVGAALIGALLVTLAGCEQQRRIPLAPTVMPPDPPVVSVPCVDPGFPSAPRDAVVYGRTSPSSIPGGQRYVLYDGSAFGLQYLRPDWGFFEYRGTYSRTGSAIAFLFDDWNTAGAWTADGTLDGDSLVVRYNVVMGLADFENGVYARQPSAASPR